MDDNPRARSKFSRLRPLRTVASQGNRSTLSAPATSSFLPDAASTPLATPDARSGPMSRMFRKPPKGPSVASPGSTSPAPPSESPSPRTPSFFRRLISSPKTPETGIRTTSDSTPSLASPSPAVADPGPMPPGAPRVVPQREAIPHKSPPEQAQEALERAGRLDARAADYIERVPGTWEAASSTAESWEGVVSKISAFASIVDAVGEVHPYLKAATSVIGGIVKPVVAQVARDKKFEELLKEMSFAYDHAIRNPSAVARLQDLPSNRQTSLLKAICLKSEQCALFIQNEYIKNFWQRAAKNTFDGGDVDEMMEEYKSGFAGLCAKWQEERSHIENANKTIDQLSPVRNAGPSSLRACLQGTRSGVLEQIRQWIDAKDSPRVLFVLGVAGSGKTALANTVAEFGRERGELGSFFAFNRNDAARVPEHLLRTVAYHLSRSNEAYRDWLAGILEADEMLADSLDISRQWKRLILEPAVAIPRSGPVLVVIDAFDECPQPADDSRQHLLDCFTLHACALPDSFRLLVTSRPLDSVVASVGAVADGSAPSVRRLDLSDFPAVEDVYLYVREQIPLPVKGGLSDWDCHELARAADGVFQWAATACRFLANKLGGTTMSAKFKANRERLFHGDPGRTQRPDGPPSLDELYSAVLDEAFDTEDATAMANFRSAVATMLCAKTPLPIYVLRSIYERALPASSGILKSVLCSMGVVLEGVSSASSPVRPMHLSFREFLLDRDRCGSWHIGEADIAHGHRILALGGLRIMASDLRFNMHSLPSSLSSGKNELKKGPCPHLALLYITSNLHTHLRKVLRWEIGDRNRNLFRGALRRILYNKLFFWIEWSLIHDERKVVWTVLRLAQKLLKGKDRRFAEDAYLLRILVRLVTFFPPPHVYLSGLAFAPAKSLVRQHFMRHFRGIPTVKPLRDTWEEIEDAPGSIDKPCLAWSTDCRYIRENGRGPSRCWDARTGDAVDVPPNVDWRSASLESADGCVKVSLSLVRGGKLVANVRSLIGCPANTTPIRFTIQTDSYGGDYRADVSPDGNWLVVVDSNHTLRLWDLGSGLLAWVPYSVSGGQLAATFSPDSREVVSSGTLEDVHYVFPIDQGKAKNDLQYYDWVLINFKPQLETANGDKLQDADLRRMGPDICAPIEYNHLICQRGVRLVLGDRLTIDYTDACYGTEWANCYAGTIEAEESEDEYAGIDVEMEESKVDFSDSEDETEDEETVLLLF